MMSAYPRLIEKEVRENADDSILFLGTGDRASIPVLLSHDYQVLCVDLAERPLEASSVNWLRADARFLNYKLLAESFDTVVLQRLCNKEFHARFPYELIVNGSLSFFDNLLIEFCDNPEHYDFKLGDGLLSQDNQSMRLLADSCDNFLKEAGYATSLVFSEDSNCLYLKLAGSRVKDPLLYVREVATGVFDPGFPPGYWDGNYYD